MWSRQWELFHCSIVYTVRWRNAAADPPAAVTPTCLFIETAVQQPGCDVCLWLIGRRSNLESSGSGMAVESKWNRFCNHRVNRCPSSAPVVLVGWQNRWHSACPLLIRQLSIPVDSSSGSNFLGFGVPVLTRKVWDCRTEIESCGSSDRELHILTYRKQNRPDVTTFSFGILGKFAESSLAFLPFGGIFLGDPVATTHDKAVIISFFFCRSYVV